MKVLVSWQNLQQQFKRRFERWLARRMPSKERQKLSQRNVFIFPSRFGLAFLAFIGLLFVLATNYQNNLMLLMSYILSSLFISSMLASFINVSGLAVSAKGQYLGYSEQEILVPVTLETSMPRYHLALNFTQDNQKSVATLSQTSIVKVPVQYTRRGRYQLPRLTLASYYPLGLFRCWTHLQFDLQVVVCPQPLHCLQHSIGQHWREQETETLLSGHSPASDNFYELRSYIPGEALNQVAWKQLAKTGQWYSKAYQPLVAEPDILSLEQLNASTIENKLRQLCFLVLEYESANLDYGLALSGDVIQPGCGQQHLHHCLTKVATYGQNRKNK